MIVPMKKVSLIIMGDKKTETLKKLRKLGMIHIEITEGSGDHLNELKEKISLLESTVFILGNKKDTESEALSLTDALKIANEISFVSISFFSSISFNNSTVANSISSFVFAQSVIAPLTPRDSI